MRHTPLLIFALVFARFAACADDAVYVGRDYPTVWSGLVFATNEPHAGAMPAELAPFRGKLEYIFGYSHFAVLGEHTEVMDDPHEHWLVPGKSFSLSAAATRSGASGYVVTLELFHDRRELVKTKVWLAPRNPLFIRGPQCGSGQLIIVLLVK